MRASRSDAPRSALRTVNAAVLLLAALPGSAQTPDLFRSDTMFGEQVTTPAAPTDDAVAAREREP